LKKAMKDLDQLQQGGLESNMLIDKAFLFAFLKSAGLDPSSDVPLDPAKVLKDLLEATVDIGNGKFLTIHDALKLALDPARHENATKTLGDQLLDFARFAYSSYENKVKDLKGKLDQAIETINQIKALQDLQNKTKVDYPDDFKLIPDELSQIPKELQEKLVEWYLEHNKPPGKNPEWDAPLKKIMKDPPPKPPESPFYYILALNDNYQMDKIQKDLRDNLKETWVDWCSDYFRTERGEIPDLPPDAPERLLKIRDNLIKQLEDLIKNGDDINKEGSPANTLDKVIKDLTDKFPLSEYPPGSNWDEFFGKTEETVDGVKKIVYKNEEAYEAAFTAAENWVKAGKGRGTVNDNLDKALSANQTLSSKMSDDLKEANLLLQQTYDICSQLMKAWDKIITGIAQKLSR
jgi:hypothetical protein